MSKRLVHLISHPAPAFGSKKVRSAAIVMTFAFAVLMIALIVAPGGASAAGSRSCGTVSLGHDSSVEVAITKGAPSCATVRSIAKDYNHPKAVKSYCHPSAHVCEYGVYPEGWRCTGLFQGNFGCWLGGDARGRGARAAFSATSVYGRPTARQP